MAAEQYGPDLSLEIDALEQQRPNPDANNYYEIASDPQLWVSDPDQNGRSLGDLIRSAQGRGFFAFPARSPEQNQDWQIQAIAQAHNLPALNKFDVAEGSFRPLTAEAARTVGATTLSAYDPEKQPVDQLPALDSYNQADSKLDKRTAQMAEHAAMAEYTFRRQLGISLAEVNRGRNRRPVNAIVGTAIGCTATAVLIVFDETWRNAIGQFAQGSWNAAVEGVAESRNALQAFGRLIDNLRQSNPKQTMRTGSSTLTNEQEMIAFVTGIRDDPTKRAAWLAKTMPRVTRKLPAITPDISDDELSL